MKIIKIFLASSASLIEYRKLFEIDINRLNKEWIKKDIFLELLLWEDFTEYMVKEGKQMEYDQSVSSCDIFVLLFSDSMGPYSREEFDYAVKTFEESPLHLPKIFTYYIEPPGGKAKDGSTGEFFTYLESLKHYPSRNTTFDEVRLKFQHDLAELNEKEAHFFFPDQTPRVNEKVQYIKMLHLTKKADHKKPVYKKLIERLQSDKEVFDEAQFFELVIYSGNAQTTLANNYILSDVGTIDMNIIIPRQNPGVGLKSFQRNDTIPGRVTRDVDLNSNVFFSVTTFINSFQENNSFYQTRADEDIKQLRLIIDFSSLPERKNIQRSAPAGIQYNDKNSAETKNLNVTEIKDCVYQVEASELKKGDNVVMNFDINWSEVL